MAPEVYDIRDPTTTEEVAARLAAGEPAAFYMGMFTIMQAVGPVGSRSASGSLFWQVKRERPSWSKLPVFLRPRDALRLADFDAVHPAFQGFRRRERFESLWSHGAPMHVVTPLRSGLRLVNDVLVTSSADAAAVASDRTVPARTAAMFWMHDPAWLRLADALARRSLPLRFLVGSSFNDHGKHPPYTLDELAEHTAARDDLAYGFVLHDPLLQDCGGFSSHSLVRLPLRGESPSLVMLRHGTVSPVWLEEATGLEVRTLASTTMAVRRPGSTDASLRAAFEQLASRRARMPA